MKKPYQVLLALILMLGLVLPSAAPVAQAQAPVNFTILHTNDFHGNLEPAGSNPGAARVAQKIADVRAAVGADKVLVFDGGDMMQGSLLSNLQKGLPAIDYYRSIGYTAATFGNHEFDWGQDVLGERISQAEAPATADENPMQMIVANIVKKDAGGACTWEPFNANVTPYEVFTVDSVKVGVIGVGSVETPYITTAAATAGLCFRDPFEAIARYYAELDAASDVIVVLSHNGYTDGGYGYGFTVYGDQTLASKLNAAGKPVSLIIGGHSHSDLGTATKVGETLVVQAHYAGRKVGRADFSFDPATGKATVNWTRLTVATSDPQYAPIKAVVDGYANDPAYKAMINQPVGYSQVDLLRNYNGDNMMGNFVQDAVYGALNGDTELANDVDMVFNNAGGIRFDWCDLEDPANPGSYIWTSEAKLCQPEGLWEHDPLLLTYGNLFQILPFGNATAVGEMTGAQIYDLLNQSATLFKGALQVSGIKYKFFRYADALPMGQPYAWGAYDVEVLDKATGTWLPLDANKTYKVATNEFLAPAGQDGFAPFKYMTKLTYWGDMLNQVIDWTRANYTIDNPYKGPDGDGTLDGRISRNGDGDDVYEAGEVVPLTILHHNDSHGRLLKSGTFAGYSQLATLIKQEKQHNPERTLLLTSGDNIQGDSMMYYFKSAGLGYAADGTPLSPEMSINPLIKAFNSMGYDAWTLGNHEFNFGKEVFGTLGQANFPILQANITDSGEYGLAAVPVEPYVLKTVGTEGIKVAILGIGNHRVPSYELPSNIPGLAFQNPIATGQQYAPALQAENDVVIALTHIGFTTDPKSVEVDENVDTIFAAQVQNIDAVIGGHSHTSPKTGYGPYKFLPTYVGQPNGAPMLVSQANRYNTFLGEVVLGLLPEGEGDGYDVVSRAGRYIEVDAAKTIEDPEIVSIVQPYQTAINAYNATVIGTTTAPIDTTTAFTAETNGANLQADASVWKLEQGLAMDVDFHLSGAMTNRLVATGAMPAAPVSLTVSDMFAAMPYENSLLVLRMNGPQLKAVLERAYRNYYYYKNVPGYGGYSYYTTCMLDTDAGNNIIYRDDATALPNGNNVAGLVIHGKPVDFTDANTYYKVSTVNYLAAGACNFSDSGKTLWPLDQIVADTQYYVRDAVIEYIQSKGAVSPAIEGRLQFVTTLPTVSVPVVSPVSTLDGVQVQAKATFTVPTPEDQPYTCAVDYGDGAGFLPGVVNGVACTGPVHSYAKNGTYTVTVRVMGVHGVYAQNFTTHMVFKWAGFFSPLRNAPTVNTVKAGSAVPVKFSLGGNQGLKVFVPGYPATTPASCTTWAPTGKASPTSGTLVYDKYKNEYNYTWKTNKAMGNTCQLLTVTLVDGTSHTVRIKLAK